MELCWGLRGGTGTGKRPDCGSTSCVLAGFGLWTGKISPPAVGRLVEGEEHMVTASSWVGVGSDVELLMVLLACCSSWRSPGRSQRKHWHGVNSVWCRDVLCFQNNQINPKEEDNNLMCPKLCN